MLDAFLWGIMIHLLIIILLLGQVVRRLGEIREAIWRLNTWRDNVSREG